MSDLLSETTREQKAMQAIAPWMQTINGNVFDFENLDSNTFDAEEIATSLSRQNRFIGHTRWPYSVAQHSVLVCRHVGRLPALLHDVAECFIGDMIAPIKHYLKSYGDNSYATLENRILAWVARVHEFPVVDFYHPEIANQDLRALATEKRDLMAVSSRQWIDLPQPWSSQIEPWHESYARDEWLRVYRELKT